MADDLITRRISQLSAGADLEATDLFAYQRGDAPAQRQTMQGVLDFLEAHGAGGLAAAVAQAARNDAVAAANVTRGIEQSAGLVSAQPNQFTRSELDTVGALRTRTATAAPVPTTFSGRPCWRISSVLNSNLDATCGLGPFLAADLSNPSIVSACITLLNVDAAGPGATAAAQAKLYLQQFNAAGVEIVAARASQIPVTSGGLGAPAFFRFESVAVDPACASFSLFLAINGGSQTVRNLHFANMMIAAGANASFRMPNDGLNVSSAATPLEAIAGSATAKFMSPATSEAARAATTETALGLVDRQPNVFTAGELDFTDTSRMPVQGRVTLSAVDGVPCWRTLTLAGAAETTATAAFNIPRANIAGDIMSVAFRILKIDPATPSANLARALIQQFNASGVEIAASRIQVDLETAPGAGRSEPKTFRIPSIPIAPACSFIRLFFGVNAQTSPNDRSIYFRDMLLAAGSVPVFRRPPASANAKRLVVVGPAGSDATGDGSTGAPFATLDAAINALGGDGAILVQYSAAYGPALRITPTGVKGHIQIYGEYGEADSAFPTVRVGAAVTGVTKTAGQVKIYQATVPGLANMGWFWQHGVPDARTLIPLGERDPAHGGRANRLPSTRILKVTDASSQAAAFAEMESAADPRFFYAGGVLYFTVVGGGDGLAASLFIDDASGLVSTGVRSANGALSIYGLNVLYGGLNGRAFRRMHLENVASIGSRANAVDWIGQFTFRQLETAAAGSFSTDGTGDGLNGHNFGSAEGAWLYSHDNIDDGESNHERGRMRLSHGRFEYNGGTACAPAGGSDSVYVDCVSLKDQRVPGRKPAAFAVIGGADAPDLGLDTRAMFIRCRAIGAVVGFSDANPATQSYGVAESCVAEDCVTQGFNISSVRDCRYIGSAPANGIKSARSVVINSTLVA